MILCPRYFEGSVKDTMAGVVSNYLEDYETKALTLMHEWVHALVGLDSKLFLAEKIFLISTDTSD